MSKQLNVFSAHVKDVLRAGEELIQPEKVGNPAKTRHPNVGLFKGVHGNGYIIPAAPNCNPLLAPCSPTDGAILEEILGNPGEQMSGGMPFSPPETKRRRRVRKKPLKSASNKGAEKDSEIVCQRLKSGDGVRCLIEVDRVHSTSPFKVVPPHPKSHEVGHWYRRLSSARLSSRSARSQTGSEEGRSGSKLSAFSRDNVHLDAHISGNLKGNEARQGSTTPMQWRKSMTGRLSKSSPTPAVHWVENGQELPEASLASQKAADGDAVESTALYQNDLSGEAEDTDSDSLSTFAKKIVDRTFLFFDNYKKSALEARKEKKMLIPLRQKPSTTRKIRSPPLQASYPSKHLGDSPRNMIVSLPESTSKNGSPLLETKGTYIADSNVSRAMFLPRATVATLNISDRDSNFRQNDRRDRPPSGVVSSIPFHSLVRLPFELEILQSELEKKRMREINVMKFSMKARRHNKRSLQHKPTPNSIFTQVQNPFFEDDHPILPGPFKRNVDVENFGTRRPKKK